MSTRRRISDALTPLSQKEQQAKTKQAVRATSSTLIQSVPDYIPTEIESQYRLKLINTAQTEIGAADLFAAIYSDQLRYCHTLKSWLVWDGTRWVTDRTGAAGRAVLHILELRSWAAESIPEQETTDGRIIPAIKRDLRKYLKKCSNYTHVSHVLSLGQINKLFTASIEDFDQDGYLAPVTGGKIDLRTGQWSKSDPSDLLMMKMGADYEPRAKCERWLRFLQEIFQGDDELIAYIKRAVGYALTGSVIEQKIFFCYGGGWNGKSKFLTVIEKMLGDYAGSVSFQSLDIEHKSKIGEDIASLRGKRFVSIIETTDDCVLDEARVKSLTGSDTIYCRFLNSNPFTYTPTYKIWMAMNHKPIIRGTDKGIWRRIVMIPFTADFEGRADANLEDKLLAELPGIFQWAIEGALEWQEQGLGSTKTLDAALKEYRAESDHIGKWMSECLTLDVMGEMLSNEAYESYHQWARERGERPFTQTAWGKLIGQRGFESHRPWAGGRRVTAYKGLRFWRDGDVVEGD